MSLSLTLPDMPGLLWRKVRQVPTGRVTTYGTLAESLGNVVAARWVGHVLLHHDHGPDCPCHRVLRAGGQLGQYAGGPPNAKRARLQAERVEVCGDRVDLARFGFAHFVGDRPLEKLTEVQNRLALSVSLRGRRTIPKLVGGLDVSYLPNGEAVGAYTLVAVETGELVWSTTVRRRVAFPYISSYLTFRELPVLVDLLAEARAAGRLAEIVLVDGTGVLHPRHAGIASHFGVTAGQPTIGVTKKLLCGQVDLKGLAARESRPVIHGGGPLGVAIRPTAGSRRPIFVSPGHRVSLAMSEAIVRSLLFGRRLPEPLYWADHLSRQAARACRTS
jgi:deoxyribonuclease V